MQGSLGTVCDSSVTCAGTARPGTAVGGAVGRGHPGCWSPALPPFCMVCLAVFLFVSLPFRM